MSEYVLVYGTLRFGEGNHPVMERAGGEWVCTFSLPGYRMYDLGWFPGVVHTGEQDDSVVVEMYKITDMRPLDALEGYRERNPEHGLYNRHRVAVVDERPWIYTINGDVSDCKVMKDWVKERG